MGLLTQVGIKRYALAKGKTYIGICDEKHCGRLILATELYTVLKWGPREDRLTFLGLKPLKIRCNVCQEHISPRPKLELKKFKCNKALKTALMKIFEKEKKLSIDTKSLISRLKRRKKFSKLKKLEFTKVLKIVKKEKLLTHIDKVWKLPKQIKSK